MLQHKIASAIFVACMHKSFLNLNMPIKANTTFQNTKGKAFLKCLFFNEDVPTCILHSIMQWTEMFNCCLVLYRAATVENIKITFLFFSFKEKYIFMLNINIL